MLPFHRPQSSTHGVAKLRRSVQIRISSLRRVSAQGF
jgi:hypothetical protein